MEKILDKLVQKLVALNKQTNKQTYFMYKNMEKIGGSIY